MSTKAVLSPRTATAGPHPMQFSLTGFSQVDGSRVFAFEGMASDRSRHPFTVQANLALARQYQIPLQDLPLLCRSMLDLCEPGGAIQAFTYGEPQMRAYADSAAQMKASRRRQPPRPQTSSQSGAGWRQPAAPEIG